MNKVKTNYIYNIIYHTFSLLTPLLTAPYMTRVLGADYIGTANYAFSIVYWFILFGLLGIRIYGSKEVAKCGDDYEKRSKIFSEIYWLQIIILSVFTILYYLVFGFMGVEFKTVILLYGLTAVATIFDISWLYVGVQQFKNVTIRDLIVKIINIIALFLFIHGTEDFLLYVILTNVFYLISQTVMWFNVKKFVKFKLVNKKDIFKHFKPNFMLFIPQLAISIYSMLDQTMLGLISDISEVGYYGYAHKFVHMFLFVTTSIGTVMLPYIASIKETNGIEKVKKFINKTFKISLLLSIPMAIGLAVIAPFVIPWFLTSDFTKTGYLISAMSSIIIFISLSNVLGMQYLVPLDRTSEYTKSVVISCIVNLILNAILIPFFGSYGAVVATVVAEASVFIIQYNFVKKEYLFKGSKPNIIKYFTAGITMGVVMLIIGFIMKIGILTGIVQFIVGITIYFGILFILKDDTLQSILSKITKRKEAK